MFERRETRGIDQTQQAEFEMQPRIRLAAQIFVGRHQYLEKASEVLFAEVLRLRGDARALIGRLGDEFGLRAGDFRDQQIANVANGFAAKMLQIVPARVKLLNKRERLLRRTVFDGGDQVVENVFRDDAEEFAHLRVGDVVAAISDGLFEKREAVAQAAFGGASENGDRARLDLQVFFFCDVFERLGNLLKRQ